MTDIDKLEIADLAIEANRRAKDRQMIFDAGHRRGYRDAEVAEHEAINSLARKIDSVDDYNPVRGE
jgi:hypothetical protein